MKTILFICLSIISLSAFSQLNVVDSLKQILNNAKHDTTRCSILNQLIEGGEPDSVWPKYNEKIKNICETQLKKIGNHSPLQYTYLRNLAGALNNIGYLAKFKGDIPKALEYYLQSLNIYEKILDKDNTANILNNIGFIYKDQGDLIKALNTFSTNLKLYTEIGNKSGIAITLNNIGTIYNDQHNFSKALENYEKCLILQEELQNKKVIAYTLNNIGFVYYRQSQLNGVEKALSKNDLISRSLEYFHRSLKIREEIQDKRGISISLQNIAEALLDQDKPKDAQFYAERSLQISNEIGYPDNIKKSSNVLSKIYSKTGYWQKAFEMQVLYKLMSDSLNNEANRKNSIQKGFQYEYDKKTTADSIKALQERKVFNVQLKQEKTQRFALYGGILLVGLFGVFMFNRFKVSKKQNHLIHKQKAELQIQKDLVDEHQKETLDSIHYAKRIQNALIANSDFITHNIPNNFIYFNPKDIVSGDFYWATKHHNKFYLAVCDSTGHGAGCLYEFTKHGVFERSY